MKKEQTNAITVDVEDYFQVSAFEKHVAPEDWDKYQVVSNVIRIGSWSYSRATG